MTIITRPDEQEKIIRACCGLADTIAISNKRFEECARK